MIEEYFKKVKEWGRINSSDLFIATLIFLVGMAGFGLGRLSVAWTEKQPITLSNEAATVNALAPGEQTALPTEGKFIGSRNGSVYHFPWCPGAQKIKEENKIWFQDKAEAEKKGYRPAANCPGL